MSNTENMKNLENSYEFIKGNGFYGLLAVIILVPFGTHFWAYKSPSKNLYYLNIFIAILLALFSVYVIYKYLQTKTAVKEMIIAFAGEENLELAYAVFNAEVGNRCIALAVISILISVATLVWNIIKLRAIPSV